MGLRPTHLFVAPGDENPGRQILQADRGNMGESNVWVGTAELVVSPWLA